MFAPPPIRRGLNTEPADQVLAPPLPVPILPPLCTSLPTLVRGRRHPPRSSSDVAQSISVRAKETARPLGVVDIGLGHVDRERNAQRIHQDMAFAPFHMFVSIKAADASRLLNRFHTDAASMMAALGCGFPPCRSRSARWSTRRRPVQIPLTQAPEVIEHRLPWQEVGRQVAPRTAGMQDVEDCIENRTKRVDGWPASFALAWQLLLKVGPLGVGQAAGIVCTHLFSVPQTPAAPLSHARGTLSPSLSRVRRKTTKPMSCTQLTCCAPGSLN